MTTKFKILTHNEKNSIYQKERCSTMGVMKKKCVMPYKHLPTRKDILWDRYFWSLSCHWNKIPEIHNLKERFIWFPFSNRFSPRLAGSKAKIAWWKGMAVECCSTTGNQELEVGIRIHISTSCLQWPTFSQVPPLTVHSPMSIAPACSNHHPKAPPLNTWDLRGTF